eukprot:TRINITY_DN22885_c0_g1_i1.p1 TRINITY_DN22885_c0_g1~~TRINITY_DN22885_c0_g1_i1.p1  ORF type:complete len:178 (+),score=28.73 TRINITY_DN22885_c0_g1_i1:64-597(+)
MAMLVCRRAAMVARPARLRTAYASRPQVRFATTSDGKKDAQAAPEGGSQWDAFWRWTTQKRPDHARMSAPWILDKLFICAVFAVAGTSTMYFIRPCLGKLGIEGSMADGPWSYRVASLFCVSPFYTLIVLTLGTLSGRHATFAKVAARMWKRMLPHSVRYRLVCPAGRAAMDAASKK